eukprot:6531559-Prymnesium_polylepis.1
MAETPETPEADRFSAPAAAWPQGLRPWWTRRAVLMILGGSSAQRFLPLNEPDGRTAPNTDRPDNVCNFIVYSVGGARRLKNKLF